MDNAIHTRHGRIYHGMVDLAVLGDAADSLQREARIRLASLPLGVPDATGAAASIFGIKHTSNTDATSSGAGIRIATRPFHMPRAALCAAIHLTSDHAGSVSETADRLRQTWVWITVRPLNMPGTPLRPAVDLTSDHAALIGEAADRLRQTWVRIAARPLDVPGASGKSTVLLPKELAGFADAAGGVAPE